MAILSSADYPAIRALLDVNLDTTLLPDATIALAPFVGAAELEIARRDPSAATRTGDEATHIKLAAILLAAAYLAPSVPRLVSSSMSGVSFSMQQATWDQIAQRLHTEADRHLTVVVGDSPAGPTHFALATGTRGKWA